MARVGTELYKTKDDLYLDRSILFIKIMQLVPTKAWISAVTYNGIEIPRHFVAGLMLPTGPVSTHLDDSLWDLAVETNATILQRGHRSDNYDPQIVLKRMTQWISYQRKASGPIGDFTDFKASLSKTS